MRSTAISTSRCLAVTALALLFAATTPTLPAFAGGGDSESDYSEDEGYEDEEESAFGDSRSGSPPYGTETRRDEDPRYDRRRYEGHRHEGQGARRPFDDGRRYGAPVTPAHPPLPPQAAVADAFGLCYADIRRFCNDVPPGGGRVIRCLGANYDRLHPECLKGMRRARDSLGY